MNQRIKKYLTPASYKHRWKKIRRSRKVSHLLKKGLGSAYFTPLWEVKLDDSGLQNSGKVSVDAFGISAGQKINWMKDVPGDHVFPLIRMDRLKMSVYWDRGIDVKYPWELSRFLFGNELAARYARSGRIEYYTRFRELVLDWIKENPFLMGVNWVCTMDVAIRATNWILAANVFSREIAEDSEFKKVFSESLVQHGSYIQAFPEIYPGKHTTNHTTADYVGLLYVARTLPDYPEAANWQRTAVRGLNMCMEYQVKSDGGSFEASAGYHRLVTELFGLGGLLCLHHSISLPGSYYAKLHSMFSFLFSICDLHGNSPLFGDNDSGTLLQYDFTRNQDYSYLKAFYSCLFNSGTGPEYNIEPPLFMNLMPLEHRLYKGLSDAQGLKISENKIFKDSGLLTFRRGELSGNVYFMPIGQNGHGGHNHLDIGSFTLFFGKQPLVVDPGTYTYTRDVALRNKFRDYSYHNTVIPHGMEDNDFNKEKLFGLDPYFKILDRSSEEDLSFLLSYLLSIHPHPITREFKMEDGVFTISDRTPGAFDVKLHLAPGVEIKETGRGLIRTNLFLLKFNPDRSYHVSPYEFAPRYQHRELSKVLTISADSDASMTFEFYHGG